MKCFKKFFKKFLLVFFLLTSPFAFSQQKSGLDIKTLKVLEDSLLLSSKQVSNMSLEEIDRVNANNGFVKNLVKALKVPYSISYGFDSLKNLSIRVSPDNKFRVLTWNMRLNDGSYKYYGTIQMNAPQLKMFPLMDRTDLMRNAQDTITDAKHWYGAQYYAIIPYVIRQKQLYLLLGWKGNSLKTNKKVIEVLSFEDGKPVFGADIFGNKKDAKRIIFEFTNQATMLLNYLPQKKLIVFDHLVPPSPQQAGLYEVYGPDLSYDGYLLTPSGMKFSENLDLRNEADLRDATFTNPIKASRILPNTSGSGQ